MFFSNWKTGFFGALSVLTELAHKIWKIADFTHEEDGEHVVNEILFYGAEDEKARIDRGSHNLVLICYLLEEARHKIDMCVPHLTSETFHTSLIKARCTRRSVPIRVAVHNMTEAHEVRDLLEYGIEVKLINSKVPLNYEFILVDLVGEYIDAVAIMGSFDYEFHRVNCNIDSTLLTSELPVLHTLQKEFDRLWHSPDNTVYDLKMVDM